MKKPSNNAQLLHLSAQIRKWRQESSIHLLVNRQFVTWFERHNKTNIEKVEAMAKEITSQYCQINEDGSFKITEKGMPIFKEGVDEKEFNELYGKFLRTPIEINVL